MGAASVATAVALALINLGLALLIVQAMGVRTFAPAWLAAVALVLGIVAAAGAARMWRAFLRARGAAG
ncbi:MAG: hypothetical protein M3336_00595 [Chloroflexota bacterium]|nr:hypothetical protein [Chloroflexota bacterium]